VVLADLQGHHGPKALAVLKMAGSLFQALALYTRIRLSASGEYIRRSLKTADAQNAIRVGRRLLFHIEQRTELGLPPKSKSYSARIESCTAVLVPLQCKYLQEIEMNFVRNVCLLAVVLSSGVSSSKAEYPAIQFNKEAIHASETEFRTFHSVQVGPARFLTFMSGGQVRLVAHGSTGNVTGDQLYTVAGLNCPSGNTCIRLVGVSSAFNGEIAAVIRIAGLTPATPADYRMVFFDADGAVKRTVSIVRPEDGVVLAIQRHSDGSIYLLGSLRKQSRLWVRKYTADGVAGVESQFERQPFRDYSFRYDVYENLDDVPIYNALSFSLGSSVGFVIQVQENSRLDRSARYPTLLQINAATGQLISASSYRTLVRENNEFRPSAIAVSGSSIILGGYSWTSVGESGTNVFVGSASDSFWLWKVDSTSNKIGWFSAYKLDKAHQAGKTLRPASLTLVGANVYVLSSIVRNEKTDGAISSPFLGWQEVDSLISKHRLELDDATPEWTFIARKEYDTARCCPKQEWDKRSSTPTNFFMLDATHMLITGSTRNRTNAQIGGYGTSNTTPIPGIMKINYGLDMWGLSVETASTSHTILEAYSHSAPFVFEDAYVP
jgi:hypothetical protein